MDERRRVRCCNRPCGGCESLARRLRIRVPRTLDSKGCGMVIWPVIRPAGVVGQAYHGCGGRCSWHTAIIGMPKGKCSQHFMQE